MGTDNANPPRPSGRGFGLSHDAWGRLILIDDEGRRFVGVEPVRAFPISEPGSWISICNAEGREILSVESLADLSAPVRQVLEEELALREFVPIVQRIVRRLGQRDPLGMDRGD